MPTSALTTGNPLLDHLILWAVIISILGGGVAVIKAHVLPFFRSLSDFLTDWSGEPERPGVSARPGVMARLEENDRQIKAVRHELHPNSGSSMRDAIDRTEQKLDEHIQQSKVMVEQGAADKAALWLEAERHTQTITELAKAVQIAAQSTPPEEPT